MCKKRAVFAMGGLQGGGLKSDRGNGRGKRCLTYGIHLANECLTPLEFHVTKGFPKVSHGCAKLWRFPPFQKIPKMGSKSSFERAIIGGNGVLGAVSRFRAENASWALCGGSLAPTPPG